MKISFDDKSYIECKRSDKPDHIIVIISAKDAENPRKKIANAVEITIEEFKKLISEV
jgi:hypothetical protein